VACEYPVVDQKRTPASAEYALSLERRVAWLESFIADLSDASPEDRERMLQSASVTHQRPQDKTSPPGTLAAPLRESLSLDEPASANLELDLDGTLIFHGATSIYRTEPHRQLPGLTAAPSSSPAESNFDHVMAHFGISLEGDIVVRALMDFFRWQYPHFMFVYREAFLRDHFGDRRDCKYWSAALLMSLCALGTLVSDDEDQRSLSGQFFLAAESIVMVSGLTRPSIPTVQAFLCLAFYEIGRGNLSKGWGFSGIAFRMAQDMGFQRDPKNWMSHDASLASSEDVEIRRRIYWGCFISDKLISLILGRPVHLAYDAAEVDPLKTLPYISHFCLMAKLTSCPVTALPWNTGAQRALKTPPIPSAAPPTFPTSWNRSASPAS
jgi:transcription factor-like protein